MLLGAHVSISGGIDKAIERGVDIGAAAIQTFASPPRTLGFTPFSTDSVAKYKELKNKSLVRSHVFHAVYLLNLANENPEYVKVSINSLVNYQTAAAEIEAIGTIFHVGSHKGVGFGMVKHQVAQAIYQVVEQSPIGVKLILENAAGHNGTIGQTLEEIEELLILAMNLGAKPNQLGVCLDTQHAFASGIDPRDESIFETYLQQVKSRIGMDMIRVIHINDSKTCCNSHKDRHENICKGEIGAVGLSRWLNYPEFKELPFILEVPGVNGKGPGIDDLRQLKELCYES